jgi:cytosine/adenosine deaminase-related metal-dependent hydrolase
MILYNVHNVAEDTLQHIHIQNGTIAGIKKQSAHLPATIAKVHLHFKDAIVFPGLINSHDHLDFNLFPPLGNSIYNNYTEWGMDIHKNNFKEIADVMKIPLHMRIQWGLYKNLLNGVTTVVNHGKKVKTNHDLVNIFQACYTLHSVAFERGWKYKLNRPFAKKIPFAIHVGEGTDIEAKREIDVLLKWNLFKRKLIGIHGVAMTNKQAAHFNALIWCPASNYFLLNATADIVAIKKQTPILFGTDSTLTAEWNFWAQLRQARQTNYLSDKELFDAVTTKAAAAWNLPAGKIAPGTIADIVVAKKNNSSSAVDAFYATDPENILLVIQHGNIRLFDASILEQLLDNGFEVNRFNKIIIGDSTKYVWGNINALMKSIKTYYPSVVLPVTE